MGDIIILARHCSHPDQTDLLLMEEREELALSVVDSLLAAQWAPKVDRVYQTQGE